MNSRWTLHSAPAGDFMDLSSRTVAYSIMPSENDWGCLIFNFLEDLRMKNENEQWILMLNVSLVLMAPILICHIVYRLSCQASLDLLVISLLRDLAGGNTRQAFIISRQQQWMSRYPGLLTHFCLISHSFSCSRTRTHTQSFCEFDNHSQVRLMCLLAGGPVSEGSDCWRER